MSRLKVLRSLQVADWPTDPELGDTRHAIVREVFSAIKSSVFSELVVVLGHDDIARFPSDVTLFETLRAMNDVRPFTLVISPIPIRGTEQQQKLMELSRLVTAQGFFSPPPAIRLSPIGPVLSVDDFH